MKNKIIKDALALTLITLVAGVALGGVYEITKDPIAKQEAQAKAEAYEQVFTDAAAFEAVEMDDTLTKTIRDQLDQEGYKAQIEKMTDKREIFEFAKERDAEMRDIIDGVFEAPVSEAVFGGMNVYAIANGLPVWCNLMMAIMDEIDTTFSREQKLTNPRISKYTAKYQKYQKK